MKISLDRLKKEQKIFLDKEIIKFESLNLRENFSGENGELEVSVTLTLVKSTEPIIELKGSISGCVGLVCDRCSDTFSKDLNCEISDIYELDKQEILDKEVDVDSKIRDFILNSFPMKILCNEDCKGFCIGCMTNLNKGSCKCKL